jgi:hypothetical protein
MDPGRRAQLQEMIEKNAREKEDSV